MALISLIFFCFLSQAKELNRFLTKYPADTLRYINEDGRTVYIQNRPGVLTVINGFNSFDIITESSNTDFLVNISSHKSKILIEGISNSHTEYNLLKNHQIFVAGLGKTSAKKIAEGRNARLHVSDEWVTYFDSYKKLIYVLNLVTDKKISINISNKNNPFFIPEVYMVNSSNILFTDIDENGISFLNSFNQNTKINTVLYKSTQSGTKLEICGNSDYISFGEFPFEGVTRQSKIMYLPLGAQTNLAGYETIYTSSDHDIGNMICKKESLFFIKSTQENEKTKVKTTDVFKLNLKDQKTTQITFNGGITQIIELDEKIIIPLRGELYLALGENNLVQDSLKSNKLSEEEELPLGL